MKIKRFVTESDEEIQKFLDEHPGAIVKTNGICIANGTIGTIFTPLDRDWETNLFIFILLYLVFFSLFGVFMRLS